MCFDWNRAIGSESFIRVDGICQNNLDHKFPQSLRNFDCLIESSLRVSGQFEKYGIGISARFKFTRADLSGAISSPRARGLCEVVGSREYRSGRFPRSRDSLKHVAK